MKCFDSEKFIREMEEHEGIYEDSAFDYDDYEQEQMRERDLKGDL